MSALLGPPALRLLLRLKLRGFARHQWRRLRTPKGFFLTLIGTAALGVWVGSLAFSLVEPRAAITGAAAELRVRAFGLLLLLLSLSTALTNRGLYVQRSEIERLFSAPLARADLVRYRLLSGGMRSLLGGLVVALFGARRMPEPGLAFAGIVLAMQTLPVVNQLVAIALGGLEQRAAHWLTRAGKLLLLSVLVVLGAVIWTLASGRPLQQVPLLGAWFDEVLSERGELFAHPLLGTLTLPFLPWARMISAPALGPFAAWGLACLALHLLLYEACARLPVDFRELSLATAARTAARVERVRRGGGVASTRASASAARWRIPWLFGRGPAGAIAWRKCAGMARKAKGAFWVALIALLFIVILANLLWKSAGEERTLLVPTTIAMLGTVYLCSGLRFDFREELERMDVIRAWPLSAARVFLATLLPEAVLVSVLLGGTVLAQAALADGFSPQVFVVLLVLPILVFTWVALDNVVFLFAPVRYVPGQDGGFVQNAGRRMIQLALLSLFGGFEAGLAWALWTLTLFLAGRLWDGSPSYAVACAFVVVLGWLAVCSGLLVWLGGLVLSRFDVARDRG